MPIYTYKCRTCGKVMEKIKSMISNGNEKCEDCGSEAIRVFSPSGLIFKGSGFYTTDYKSSSAKSDPKSDSGKPEKKETKKPESSSTKPVDSKDKTSTAKDNTGK